MWVGPAVDCPCVAQPPPMSPKGGGGQFIAPQHRSTEAPRTQCRAVPWRVVCPRACGGCLWAHPCAVGLPVCVPSDIGRHAANSPHKKTNASKSGARRQRRRWPATVWARHPATPAGLDSQQNTAHTRRRHRSRRKTGSPKHTHWGGPVFNLRGMGLTEPPLDPHPQAFA